MATKEKKPKKTKHKPTPEPFWNELVNIYFKFCQNKFNESPSFDGSAPRNLKNIIKTLHERANKSEVEWTLEVAQRRLQMFLDYAYTDTWLQKNFLLQNIDRQKDKIFFNIRAAIQRRPQHPFE